MTLVKYDKNKDCPRCFGEGKIHINRNIDPVECPRCKGSGNK